MAAPPGMDPALYQRIVDEYPSFLYLLAIPEVAALLIKAVDPNNPFSPDAFESQLHETNWWKTTSDAQRTWDALQGTDPASAQAAVTQRMSDVAAYAARLGVTLTADQIKYIAITGLRDGVAVGSALFNTNVVGLATGPEQAGGDLYAAYAQVKQLANSDYMIGIADQDAWEWAKGIAAGTASLDSAKAMFSRIAVGRFPQYADLITKDGVTPGQLFAPTKAAIAQTLELGPDQVDLLDPKWGNVLANQADPNHMAMTISQAVSYAKSLPEWKTTSTARQQGSDLTAQLLQTFGAIK